MSDLFKNHIVGFPTRWLICKASKQIFLKTKNHSRLSLFIVLSNSNGFKILFLISEIIAKMKKASSKAEDSFEEGELSNSDDNG